mgnify:CR=1 FL=1
MAHNDQEIEIKLRLSYKEYKRIKEELKKITKFVKFSHHIDEYFTPRHKSFLQPKYPYEWLTLRHRDDKVLLNYKHWYPENTPNTTHCDEYETQVLDGKQLKSILRALNFKKFVTVEKKRATYVYKDGLEIALDEVKDLGYFIEIETIKDFGDLKKARVAIFKFARKLGLYKTTTIPGGYGAELMRKKGLLTS